jgi:dienelactone hydrolase
LSRRSASHEIELPALITGALGASGWRTRREDIRRRIRAVLGARPPAPPPAPAPRVLDRVNYGSYARLTIEFKVAAGEEIPAYVYRPKGTGPAPGLVAFHQTADDGKEEVAGLTGASPRMAYAPPLAAAGFAVISFDDVAAGDRIRPGDLPYYTRAFYERHPDWSVLDKAVCDGRQALDVLASFAEVDAARLGAVGHSQGGLYAWMLAAEDERVKAAVANCGFGTLRGDETPERWARDSWFVALPGLAPAIAARDFPFDFHEWAALVAPRALLLMGAKNDFTLPNWRGFEAAAAELARLYAALGAPEKFKAVLTDGMHDFTPAAQNEMLAFLKANL